MEILYWLIGISVFMNIVQWMTGSQRKQEIRWLYAQFENPDFLLMHLRRITRSRHMRWDNDNSAPQFDLQVARTRDVADSDDFSDDWAQPRQGGAGWTWIVVIALFLFILFNLVNVVIAHP